MNQKVSKPLLIGAIALVAAVVALIGYNSLHDSGVTRIPVPPPVKQTESMPANPRPGHTMGSSSSKTEAAH